MQISYSLKFSRDKIFVDFMGQRMAMKFFSPWNFKFITDARYGWKLDQENFIHDFWAELGKTTKYLILENFRLYGSARLVYEWNWTTDYDWLPIKKFAERLSTLQCALLNFQPFCHIWAMSWSPWCQCISGQSTTPPSLLVFESRVQTSSSPSTLPSIYTDRSIQYHLLITLSIIYSCP